MVCNKDIVPALVRMKYDDHELLMLEDVTNDPYVSFPTVKGGPIERIPRDWAKGMDKDGLLGLINMLHFG